MKTRALGLGLVVILATAVSGFAETFPLTFKTVAKKDLRRFPGGSGSYGQLRLQKPSGLHREPKPASKTPLYAECSGSGRKNFIARLDESKDGKGYDRLIVDLNQNGDLTDDPVASIDPSGENGPDQNRMLEFGPLQAPSSMAVCGGVPQITAEVYVVNAEYLRSGEDRANMYAGQVMLKAAWYLTATARLNGRSHLIGVYDANGNFKLGDAPSYSTYKQAPGSKEPENWYVGGGDTFLIDADNSGAFESDRLGSESLALAPLVYLDKAPYKIALSSDRTSVSIEKWSDALAEVTVEPKGAQVRTLTVAWQRGKEDWEVLRPTVEHGKFKVPPGKYRLFTCTLIGEESGKTPVMASAYDRVVRDMLRFETGKANTLRCGGPLDVKVTAEKRAPRPYENMGSMQTHAQDDSEFVLAINANVLGSGGEAYNSYAAGKAFTQSANKPSFVIADAGGRKIANGNLEFG
jgi:hypothetical protein